MGEIENIAAQILMGYADIVKQTGSLLQLDANISLDQYLKVREIAKKEKYMYKDAFVSGSTSVEENRVPEKKNNRSSPDVGKFYPENDICYNQQKIENDPTKTAVNTNINAENIKSTVISLPNLDEQRKISEYLGNLDHLITLHQRELEILKNLKKTCLKRMFI